MKVALTPSQLRITALWAFSEAFLGGILHGLQVPFSGLILSAFAAICISAIAMKDHAKGKIIHATLLVMIVKATLSPHTPVTAYFAVGLQGLFGEMMFAVAGYKLASYSTAIFALLQSACQKLIVLTILFGMAFWKAMDDFLNDVMESFGMKNSSPSLYIIMIYLFIYFIAGIVAGRFASRLPLFAGKEVNNNYSEFTVASVTLKRKSRLSSPLFWILFALFAVFIFEIYYSENTLSLIESKAFRLIVRSMIILVFWYFFLSPLLLQLMKKWLEKKKGALAEETSAILVLIPQMKLMVFNAWQQSAGSKNRIGQFIQLTFTDLLSSVK